MSTINKRTIQKPKPGRTQEEEDQFRVHVSDMEYENYELKGENRKLRRLVVELSLEKLEAEQNF